MEGTSGDLPLHVLKAWRLVPWRRRRSSRAAWGGGLEQRDREGGSRGLRVVVTMRSASLAGGFEHAPGKRARMSRTWVVLALATTLGVGDAATLWSFDGGEHYRVSQAAIKLAYEYVSTVASADISGPDLKGLCEPDGLFRAGRTMFSREAEMLGTLRTDSPSSFQYGDFVMHVDSVDDPLKLLRPDPSVRIDGSPRYESDLDRHYLTKIPTRLSGKLHAMHSNTSHFQDHLMFSLWEWQRQARREAFLAGRDASESRCCEDAVRGTQGQTQSAVGDLRPSLYNALLKNAVSAHFLQDVFAPGHVASPRDAHADYAANTMHDRYNATGACFRLTQERVNDELRKIYSVLGPCVPGEREADSITPPFDGETGKQECRNLLREDIRAQLDFPNTQSLDEAWEDLSNPDCTPGNHRCSGWSEVFLRGDGDLLNPSTTGVAGGPEKGADCGTDNCELESRTQRLLVTLVVAQSIVDVFRSYAQGYANTLECVDDEEFFFPYTWHRMELKEPRLFNREKVRMPRAEFVFGEYSDRPESSLPENPKYGFMGLIDLGLATFLEGEKEGGRGVLGIEWLPSWGPPGMEVENVYVPKFYSFAIGAGAGYRWDEDLPGFDATFRWYLLWPKVDMHVSAGVRVSEFHLVDKHTVRVAPEVRFGKSLGFVAVYLGLASDFRESAAGGLDRSLAIQSGIQLAVPWWRSKRWLVRQFTG